MSRRGVRCTVMGLMAMVAVVGIAFGIVVIAVRDLAPAKLAEPERFPEPPSRM